MVEFLRRNWGYKLVSVFLAVLLWLYVSSTMAGVQNSSTVALQAKGLPSNLVMTSRIPSTVSVKLQGSPSAADKDIVAYVDLSGGSAGEKTYPVIVAAPPNVTVLSVEPATVTISLDKLQEKTLPVSVVTSGNVGPGFEAGTPVVRPSSVTVFGPAKELGEIAQVFVQVDLGNATDTVDSNPVVQFRDKKGNPIGSPDPAHPILTAEPQSVDVIIPVLQKGLASRMVPITAGYKGVPAAGYAVTQVIAVPDVVKVYGSMSALQSVNSINAGSVDVSGASQDIAIQVNPQNLSLPPGVSVQAGTQISIVAHLGSAQISRMIKNVPITIQAPTGLQATTSTQTLDVTLNGPANVVNGIRDSDVNLIADASGISSGQQGKVTPYLAQPLPSGVSIGSLPQITVSVK